MRTHTRTYAAGMLTTFWDEQRRMLHAKKGTKWHPQVLYYCLWLWIRIGRKPFNTLRKILVLPSQRTLQMYKARIPHGDGYQSDLVQEVGRLWSQSAKTRSDYDCIISWDATGYSKLLSFDKHSGSLLGFGVSPESFSMVHIFANKVNCFVVRSPQKHIKIEFPIAYYHCSNLDSADIRRQWFDVMEAVDSIGLRPVALVCDGASEHAKFFNMILRETAAKDPGLLVRLGDMWVISDPPHLLKKFRNNWLSSGQLPRHTRQLYMDGCLISWKIIEVVYRLANTERMLRILPKLIEDAVDPTSVMRLRVRLAAIVFSKEVQLFISRNITQVADKAGVREEDVSATLEFMKMVWELFQIMNSTKPFTWTTDQDNDGKPIGLRDKLDVSKGLTLNAFSKQYGVSVDYLKEVSGLGASFDVPDSGSTIIIDRCERLLHIARYFKNWRERVYSLPDISDSEKEKLFITHWLYTDLRRCCYGMVGMLRQYVPRTDRCWVPRRFNQDPIEKLYGKVRELSGSNTDLTMRSVDYAFDQVRSLGLQSVKYVIP